MPQHWTVSIILAVILSIVGNLLTPLVQRGLDKLSSARAGRSAAKQAAEQDRLRRLRAQPIELTIVLIAGTLKAAICYAAASVVTAISNLPEQFITPQYMSDFTSGLLGAVGALLYLVSMLIALDMLRTVARLRALVH